MTNILKYILIFLSLSVVYTSCGKNENIKMDNRFSNVDVNGVLSQEIPDMVKSVEEKHFQLEIRVPDNNQNIVLMSDIIDSVWYVKLGDIPTDLMSDWLGEIEIHNHRIYIRDGQKNQVYVFDINGDFLHSIDPSGDGPGEFSRAGSIAVDPYKNQLAIHDDRLSKVLYYTLEGRFLSEQKVGFRFLDFAFVNDSVVAVDLNKTDNHHLPEISNNQVVLVDTTWKVLAKGGGYNAEEEQRLFFTGGVFSRSSDQLLYLQPFTSDVYKFETGGLAPYCRIDFGNRNLPEDANFKFTSIKEFGREHLNYSYIVANGHFLQDVTYFEHLYGEMKTAHYFRSNTTGNIYHGSVSNDLSELGFFQVSTSIPEENVLISYISSEEIYAKRRTMLADARGSKALRDLVTNTESTDNPVLIFYKLKTDY